MDDIFDSAVMLETLRIVVPVRTFILDTFFASKTPETHPTDTLHLDLVVGKRVLAPYVQPCAAHKTVDRAGAESREVRLPYIKVKRDITACCQLLKRSPGEDRYSGRTPQQRAQAMLAQDLIDLREMIQRRLEWQAAQALTTGKSNLKGEDWNDIVDFRMPAAHLVVNGATDRWDAATSDPIKQIRSWRSRIARSSGTTPNVMVGGTGAIEAFLDNPKVREKLKTDSGLNAGSVNLNVEQVEGPIFYGRIAGVEVWEYSEFFYDPVENIDGNIIPDNRIVLGSRNSRAQVHYGVIQDLKANNPQVDMFPSSWEVDDPSVRFVGVQSSPLAVPFQPDAFVSAQVLA